MMPMRSSCNEITKKQMQEYIDTSVQNAKDLKSLGFEFFSVHNAYRGGIAAQLWSPITNQRKDEYGPDSVKNRTRFMLEFFDALRQTFGKDFPLEVLVSGCEEGGASVADTIELAKLAEGIIDVIHIRNGNQDPQHPTGFTSSRNNPCPNLDVAAAVKESVKARGGKILVAASAGMQNPDFCEAAVRDGKCDIVASARTWICDPEYGTKLYEGRGEDVTPCVRCNKCHVPNDTDKYRSFCSVNPVMGLEDKLDRMVKPVGEKKKVGIIGGGPGGMQAAVTAAKRGHEVVLFEKENKLGGQLSHSEYASFKWPIKDYIDWQAKQMEKHGVDVRLGVEATPEMLDEFKFDEVIVAIGPEFTRPNLPGADGPNTMLAIDTYGHEAELPHKIIVIGGSETGVETGMYLAENGHDVTVMCRKSSLASDAAHAHYVEMLKAAYRALPDFHELCKVKYTAIDDKGVCYIDKNGNECHIDADLVVLATGAKPRPEEAGKFYGHATKTSYIGDCFRVANMHFAIQHGFATASQI